MLFKNAKTDEDKFTIIELYLEMAMIAIASLSKQLKKHETTVGLHERAETDCAEQIRK